MGKLICWAIVWAMFFVGGSAIIVGIASFVTWEAVTPANSALVRALMSAWGLFVLLACIAVENEK